MAGNCHCSPKTIPDQCKVYAFLMPRFGMLFWHAFAALLKTGRLLPRIRSSLPKMQKTFSEDRWLCTHLSFLKRCRFATDLPELCLGLCHVNPEAVPLMCIITF